MTVRAQIAAEEHQEDASCWENIFACGSLESLPRLLCWVINSLLFLLEWVISMFPSAQGSLGSSYIG